MADRTAHDTVRDVAFERFVEWDDSHTLADAVLAALGIDPDTPTDDVKADLTAGRLLRAGWRLSADDFDTGVVVLDGHPALRKFVAVADSPGNTHGEGASYAAAMPSYAAAMLALAARLEAPRG
jgi:hypothetical protein